jgi:VWFA-related protein
MNTVTLRPLAGNKARECLRFPWLRRSVLFVFSIKVVLLACFFFPQAWSSESKQATSTSTEAETPAVAPNSSTILITARFKDGAPIGLSTSEIEIKADGKSASVQEVVGNGPLHYCLLFDSSVSQQDRFKLQQDEAIELLSKVVKDGTDHGMLVDFSDNYYLDGEGTNPQKFANHIGVQRPEGRGTALYDAVIASANHMTQSIADRSARVMFIFSHGEDNESVTNLERAAQFAVNAGMRIYVIGQVATQDPAYLLHYKSVKSLKELAERTGGKAYFPEQKDAGKAVADIADEMANRFAVTFTLPEHAKDKKLGKLEVRCNKKDVSIRAPEHF